MADEQSSEDRPEDISLASAEAAFQYALDLLSEAREDLRARMLRGEVPDTVDIKAMMDDLSKAWQQAQRERDRVAEYRRKHGAGIGVEFDLEAARAEVCEQLDRIAAAR